MFIINPSYKLTLTVQYLDFYFGWDFSVCLDVWIRIHVWTKWEHPRRKGLMLLYYFDYKISVRNWLITLQCAFLYVSVLINSFNFSLKNIPSWLNLDSTWNMIKYWSLQIRQGAALNVLRIISLFKYLSKIAVCPLQNVYWTAYFLMWPYLWNVHLVPLLIKVYHRRAFLDMDCFESNFNNINPYDIGKYLIWQGKTLASKKMTKFGFF